MSNNMCLKSSSESEEMGTDERHWKNEQDLGMMLCKSKEVGGVKNDSLCSCLNNWMNVNALHQDWELRRKNRLGRGDEFCRGCIDFEAVFPTGSLMCLGLKRWLYTEKYIYIFGDKQRGAETMGENLDWWQVYIFSPSQDLDGATWANVSVNTAIHSIFFHFDKKWKSSSL